MYDVSLASWRPFNLPHSITSSNENLKTLPLHVITAEKSQKSHCPSFIPLSQFESLHTWPFSWLCRGKMPVVFEALFPLILNYVDKLCFSLRIEAEIPQIKCLLCRKASPQSL